MREGLIRLFWPALVTVAFCLPLFIALGNHDLRGDEAGHSFSVDRILETGEWLIPKSSPHPDAPFLEKPPLKFWIVAAGIRAGLPHDEFGLRFWDPLFGGLAFLYVFAIGRRISGPLCGAVAVFILFLNHNLLFEHGLRDNAMEAPLLLSYCGGVFHYLGWTSSESRRSRRLHAIAVAVYFVLGFMVKFVAALFLPMVVGLATLIVRSYRQRFFGDWRTWLSASLVALALAAPWFAYATHLFGAEFWQVILGTHVYTRLTSYLDPSHLQPWHHYFTETCQGLRDAHVFWLVAAGAALFVFDTIRRRWPEGLLILLWFAVPMTAMSFATSKLYHYAYPFLPPVGLAAGYVLSRVWRALWPYVDPVMDGIRPLDRVASWSSGLADALRRPSVRTLLLVLGLVAVGAFVWTMVMGPFSVHVAGIRIRNSRLLRPALVGVLLLVLGGRMRLTGRFAVAALILFWLPISAYRTTLHALGDGYRVFRPARDCILRVGSDPRMTTSGQRGMYVDGDGIDYQLPFNHEFAYYFRTVNPWIRPAETPPARLYQFMADPTEQRPLLMTASRYHAVLRSTLTGKPLSAQSRVGLHDDVVLVLPGPYSVCGPEHLMFRQVP